jgi:hypothetical protein
MSVEVHEFASRSYIYSKPVIEWNSGDRGQMIDWSVTSTSNVIYHTVKLQNPALFEESSNQAGWGSFYYAMGSVSDSGVI